VISAAVDFNNIVLCCQLLTAWPLYAWAGMLSAQHSQHCAMGFGQQVRTMQWGNKQGVSQTRPKTQTLANSGTGWSHKGTRWESHEPVQAAHNSMLQRPNVDAVPCASQAVVCLTWHNIFWAQTKTSATHTKHAQRQPYCKCALDSMCTSGKAQMHPQVAAAVCWHMAVVCTRPCHRTHQLAAAAAADQPMQLHVASSSTSRHQARGG
jgi:hypothetical protein